MSKMLQNGNRPFLSKHPCQDSQQYHSAICVLLKSHSWRLLDLWICNMFRLIARLLLLRQKSRILPHLQCKTSTLECQEILDWLMFGSPLIKDYKLLNGILVKLANHLLWRTLDRWAIEQTSSYMTFLLSLPQLHSYSCRVTHAVFVEAPCRRAKSWKPCRRPLP